MKKDRGFIAISAIWYERYLECSRTYRTNVFPDSVWRFYHSLLNLSKDDEELKIRDIVTEYLNTKWRPKINSIIENNTKDTSDLDTINSESKIIESQYIHELFYFIIQTIQDSGVGWPTHQELDQYFVGQE